MTIAETWFKNARYVRLYKNGKRHTVSIEKLLYQLFKGQIEIPLDEGERAFRYKDRSYFITSRCRVYNIKFRRFITVVYRNGYPTVNISDAGKVIAVSIIKFLKSNGGII
jgi:hypothetical protein